ncbi:MAG: acylphosphatase, partial [Xanthobacteraceae bacterium]
MSTQDRAVRLLITGRVQGIGFRAFVEYEATRRSLRGWVRNRRDGAVEATIAGPAAAVEAVIDACRRGPPAARVDFVDVR